LFKSRPNSARFFEPPDAAFDHVSAAVDLAVESGAALLVGAGRNHILDAMVGEPFSDSRAAESFVARHGAWARPRTSSALRHTDGFHHRFEHRRLVRLSRRHIDREGSALCIYDYMDLGSPTPARPPERVMRRLAFLASVFLGAPAAARAARMEEPSK